MAAQVPPRELETIHRDLSAVDQQILEFENLLQQAKELRKKLDVERNNAQLELQKQRQAEAERQTAAAAAVAEKGRQEQKAAEAQAQQATTTAATSSSSTSPEDLQRRIAELQNQISAIDGQSNQEQEVLAREKLIEQETQGRAAVKVAAERLAKEEADRNAALERAEQERRRRCAEEERKAAAASVVADTTKESPDELQKRIAELQNQISVLDQQTRTPSQQEIPIYDDEEESEYEEEYIEEEIIESDDEGHTAREPSSNLNQSSLSDAEVQAMRKKVEWKKPNWALPRTTLSSRGSKIPAEQNGVGPSTAATVKASAAPEEHYGPGEATPPEPRPEDQAYEQQMQAIRTKHEWEKPAWALPSTDNGGGDDIVRDSVQNPLLKQREHNGYVRKVKPKENLEVIKGTFRTPTTSNIDARLAWIVLNVNKRKVGKIVMHLYGKDVDGLVGNFLDLKGEVMEFGKVKGSKSLLLQTLDVEPKLYITVDSAKGLDKKSDVYGVIQEGHDILAKVQAAGEGALITVKQAHIYPVKKSRGS